jgi:hemerythrin superfamily protein
VALMKRPKKKSKARSKKPAKTTYEQIGSAIAATASSAVARIRELASPKSAEIDPSPRATDLLVHHHRKIEGLFERLGSSKGRFDDVLRELADDLAAHIAIEEKLFYPAVRALNTEVVLEGLEEHAMGRFALQRLLGTTEGHESLKARLGALKELMTNHHKEEEDDLFPKARKAMSNDALQELGTKMKKRFDDHVQRGHEATLASFEDHFRTPVRAKTPKRRQTPKRRAAARA